MGGALSDLELFPYEHWMPDEDPTFYIPASMTLTDSQRAQLHATGFQQGEPFMLTKDGLMTKPTSKKFSLQGMKSSFAIRKGSLQLFEESPGNFSLEFYYFAEEAVILEIHISAVDASSSKYIKLKQSELKWGPYKLNPSSQPSTPLANTTTSLNSINNNITSITTTITPSIPPITTTTTTDAQSEEKTFFSHPHTSSVSPSPRSRSGTSPRSRSNTSPRSRSNTYSKHGYLIVDVTELDDSDDGESKPTDTADDDSSTNIGTNSTANNTNHTTNHTTNLVSNTHTATTNATTTPTDTNSDTVQYTQWSSRKFQHKQLASPLPHITQLHLPSLGTPVLTTGVYDVVLIVTTADHVASAATTTANTTNSGKRMHVTHNTNSVHSTHSTSNTLSKPAHSTTNTTTNPNTNTTTTSNANSYNTQASWLTRRACQKIIPVRTNSLCGGLDNVVVHNANSTSNITNTPDVGKGAGATTSANTSTNINTNTNNSTTTITNINTNTTHNNTTTRSTSSRHYSSVPAIDLSENPHSEAYQVVNTESDIETLPGTTRTTRVRSASTVTTNTSASKVPFTNNNISGNSISATHAINNTTTANGHVAPHKTTHNSKHSSNINCVQREAFFCRVNAESYNKRHAINTTIVVPGKSGTASINKAGNSAITADSKNRGVGANNSISNSVSSDSVKYSIGSSSSDTHTNMVHAKPGGIYMRSKGVTLDLCMQLFQVPTGVYNRITLYGMEGFMAPTNTNGGGVDSSTSASSDSADSTDANAQSKPPTHTHTSTNTNTNTRSRVESDATPGADCIICLSNKQTTIMFPCRHLCLCAECANTVATHANISGNMSAAQRQSAQEKKCPVCRKPVIVMFQLKP